jgi:S-adenosylhomocysteine hydrolase
LIALVRRCLARDPAAINVATQLVAGITEDHPADDVRLAAAADLLCREARSVNDKVLDVLVDERLHALTRPLPLVEALGKQFSVDENSSLAGADVLVCQHLMASTAAMLMAIRDAIPRLYFARVFGKPYSANLEAVQALISAGFTIDQDSLVMPNLNQHPFGSFARRQRKVLRSAVSSYVAARREPDRPLLLIDDGGVLIDAVGHKVLDGSITCPVIAIEQTTHGTFALDKRFFQSETARHRGFAVISAASSQAKLGREPAIIARSVLREADHWLKILQAMGLFTKREPRVGLIGFGVLGAAIAVELSQSGRSVAIYDRNRHKRGLVHALNAKNVEMSWSLDDLLRYSDVVIGASGGTSINKAAAPDLHDGTVLISASSGDLEFSGLRDWDLECIPVLPGGLTTFDHAHGVVVARREGRTVVVPNRGFPINFNGAPDPIAAEEIGVTRAIMFGAVLQAAGVAPRGRSLVGATGEYEVADQIDRFVVSQYDRGGGDGVR